MRVDGLKGFSWLDEKKEGQEKTTTDATYVTL
jgi:hypothetical protein